MEITNILQLSLHLDPRPCETTPSTKMEIWHWIWPLLHVEYSAVVVVASLKKEQTTTGNTTILIFFNIWCNINFVLEFLRFLTWTDAIEPGLGISGPYPGKNPPQLFSWFSFSTKHRFYWLNLGGQTFNSRMEGLVRWLSNQIPSASTRNGFYVALWKWRLILIIEFK